MVSTRPRAMVGDPGLFGPGSMAWRIDGEVLVLAGGTCALLMQLAHPAVAAGVHQHLPIDAPRDAAWPEQTGIAGHGPWPGAHHG